MQVCARAVCSCLILSLCVCVCDVGDGEHGHHIVTLGAEELEHLWAERGREGECPYIT